MGRGVTRELPRPVQEKRGAAFTQLGKTERRRRSGVQGNSLESRWSLRNDGEGMLISFAARLTRGLGCGGKKKEGGVIVWEGGSWNKNLEI